MEFEQNQLKHRLTIAVAHQSRIQRYALHHTIRSQNVAEHVGRAAMLTAVLFAELRHVLPWMNEHTQLQLLITNAVLTHDLAESMIGDIPYPVKQEFAALQGIEAGVHHALLGGYLDDYIVGSTPNGSKVIPAFVGMVDMAELVMFCQEEVRCGNSTLLPLLAKGIRILEEECVPRFLTVFRDWYEPLDEGLTPLPDGFQFTALNAIINGEHV